MADETLRSELGDEIADILSFALLLAHELDPAELIACKLAKNEQWFPVDKNRGRSTTYDKL